VVAQAGTVGDRDDAPTSYLARLTVSACHDMRGPLCCLNFALQGRSGSLDLEAVRVATARLTRMVQTLDLVARTWQGTVEGAQVGLAAADLVHRACQLTIGPGGAAGEVRWRGSAVVPGPTEAPCAANWNGSGTVRDDLRIAAHEPGTVLALAIALDLALSSAPLGTPVAISADHDPPATTGQVCLRVVPAIPCQDLSTASWQRFPMPGPIGGAETDARLPPHRAGPQTVRREFALVSAASFAALSGGELVVWSGPASELALALVLRTEGPARDGGRTV